MLKTGQTLENNLIKPFISGKTPENNLIKQSVVSGNAENRTDT